MIRMTLVVATLTSIAALAGHAADRPTPGFADPVLGRWDLTVEGDSGPYPSWLDIRLRTEWELMAELVGQFGSARHATSVTYQDGSLTVRVPVQYESGNDDLEFTGRLDSGALAGQVRMGDGTLLDWHGVRAPSLARGGISGWGKPVSLIGDDLTGWRPRD
ncbi:MAG: hypothetical protein OEV41_06665, partial [Gammaproteobacteria bacterium]|nr:hypothetical protein [Gammaproteobacteria bacterium]